MDLRTLDQRSLAMHEHVAALLRAHPERLAEAQALILRWRASAGPRTVPVLDEWSALLGAGLDATLAATLDPSDEGDRLRQSSPLPLLGARERWAFLSAFRANHAA